MTLQKDSGVPEYSREEDNLTIEEADQNIWEKPEKSSSGSEEKDITD